MSFYTFMPTLLNMSLTASVAIVLVTLLRLLLKKAPKVISYALWGVVLFRLLCPVSIGSDFSVYNLFDTPTEESGTATSIIEYVPSNIVHTEYPAVALPVPGISDAINETLPQGEEQLRADPLEGPIFIATYVWMAGVLAMVIYSIVSYIRLRRKLSVVIPLRDNIFIADDIKSPFVVGLFRPKIYLPCNLGDKEQEYIILHEQHHIKRLDHVMKALAFLALAIHWFNPLVWVAFVLASKDMEMSCDEAVIEQFGNEIKQGYSNSLLSFAMERHPYSFAPVAFGEGDAGRRIKNVLNFKKPHTWVAILVFVLLVVVGVSCLTNGKDKISSETVSDTENSQMQQTAVETTEAPMSSDNSSTVQESLQSVDKWTQAFAARDVRTIQDMATDDAKNELKEENLLDDNGNFGWSSPWPWFDEESGMPAYQITQSDDTSATILYYAQVSDPHVTVWKETLQYTRKDDKIEIAHEELQMLNFIASGSEFENAYPKGIQNTPMDYQANGLGETLNEHAISANGMNPDGEYNLTDPMEAAQYLLNLLRNDDKVEITADKKDKTQVELKVHFTEDDITHHITMIRPWGEDGIWVVGEIL